MIETVAGVYSSVGFKSIGSLEHNTLKVQELLQKGVQNYLSIELSNNHDKNSDHFGMLEQYGFAMGARFPFSLFNTLPDSTIEQFSYLDAYYSLDHLYMGHEVMEKMTQKQRFDTFKQLRTFFPNTPIRTYYGGVKALYRPHHRCNSEHSNGGRWQEYTFMHETPKNDGRGLIVHWSAGLSSKFESFPGRHPKQMVIDFLSAKQFIEANSPWSHQYAIHINVKDDYTDVSNLLAEMQALANVGCDWVYLRPVDANNTTQRTTTTETMLQAIGEFNT